jgi:hypothetical protein
LSAADPDLPANLLAFAFEGAVPSGMAIDPATGQISWIPQEAQGPGDYSIAVRVTDSGTPPLSAAQSFTVRVNEANNSPILDAILPVAVDEGQTVTLIARAVDPDSPPATITYSLEGPAPAGAAIDPITGVLTWATSELHGPSTNLITVRATEKNSDALSDSRNFSIVVREINQAPVISPVEDMVVADGAIASIRLQVRDNDSPAQALAYELLGGAPAGASIDSQGVVRWEVPLDHAASTNSIAVRVTDDGPGALSASTTLRIVVRPEVRVAISEIMHSPQAPNGHYIELHNASGASAWDLSGWVLRGQDLSFTFPANSVLQAGGQMIVAQNRAAFAAAYGASIPVAGEWSGALRGDGDRLTLHQGDALIDIVTFGAAAPWPSASGGAALQLVDARQDNNRLANWQAAGGYAGPTNLIAHTSAWRFNQSGTDLGSGWRAPAYNDASWSSGAGLFYLEDAALPAPKTTLLTRGPSTFYFRTKFNLPVKPLGAQLRLSLILDDGAVVYLNGTEIHRVRMPDGAPAYGTFATTVVDNAVEEGPFVIPGDALVAGENVVAVEVHQVNAGSSDVVMGLALNLSGGQVANRTPGQPNSVRASLAPFAPVFLNEVLAVNANGSADSAGEREPWVELYNAGQAPVSLDGCFLSDSHLTLNRWGFPPGASIAPGEFKVIWLDNESGETIGSEWHANFRLGVPGTLVLARAQEGQHAILDYVSFGAAAADVSFGSMPDGQLNDRSAMSPTPGAANSALQANRPPVIQTLGSVTVNEGHLLQFPVQASDPDQGQILAYRLENAPAGASIDSSGVFRWTPTEAQGPSTNVIRAIVTDSGLPPLSATNEWVVRVSEVNAAPEIAAVPPQTASVGAALTVQFTATDPDLPVQTLSFALSGGASLGATIDAASGLFVWKPSAAHANSTNSFEVTVSDSGAPARQAAAVLQVVVGAAPNAEPPVASARISRGSCLLSWSAEPGRSYRVWAREQIGSGGWMQMGEVTATGPAAAFSDPSPLGARRFYRIEALP